MDLIKAFKSNVTKSLCVVDGLKILLMDSQTMGMISMVFPESEMHAHQIFLFDFVSNSQRSQLKYLKCICFLRPSFESINDLILELRSPKYSEYYIYFTNGIKDSALERIAEADVFASVKGISEIFVDFLPINRDFFSLETSKCIGGSIESWNGIKLQRCVEGISSLLVLLKKRPLIRYDKQSAMTQELAMKIYAAMQAQDASTEYPQVDTPPILLILDRRCDPVTPLLMQWTYQAMVHEVFGIERGLVSLTTSNGVEKKFDLSCKEDTFFVDNMYSDLGQLGQNIDACVKELDGIKSSKETVKSQNNALEFLKDLPRLTERTANIHKHISLLEEVTKMAEENAFFEVSEFEQYLVDESTSHDSNVRNLYQLFSKENVTDHCKIKSLLLFVIRYQNRPGFNLTRLKEELAPMLKDSSNLAIITDFFLYNSIKYKYESPKTAGSILQKVIKDYNSGKENIIYTRHEPLLSSILDQLRRGRLPEDLFPSYRGISKDRPHEVIIFFVNGVTFEEAKTVATHNLNNPNCSVVLGGNCILNSKTFLVDVQSIRN